MKSALEARLPMSLQTPFNIIVGKKALAELLIDTGLCTWEWYTKVGGIGEHMSDMDNRSRRMKRRDAAMQSGEE